MQQCARCGAAIDTDDWYPIHVGSGPGGAPQVYAFCSEACRARWVGD